MAIDLNDWMARVVAIEKEGMAALSTPVAVDAKPYFLHTQESFPYFTNRVNTITIEEDSEDIDEYTYEIIVRLVIGHITDKYKGQNDSLLNDYIPHMIQYFNERVGLQSETYPAAPDDLEWMRCVQCTGYRVFQNTGVGTSQVGTEFTLRLRAREEIEQQYA